MFPIREQEFRFGYQAADQDHRLTEPTEAGRILNKAPANRGIADDRTKHRTRKKHPNANRIPLPPD